MLTQAKLWFWLDHLEEFARHASAVNVRLTWSKA